MPKSTNYKIPVIALQPVTEVNFPSVTLCNANGPDTGEYVRNVFNNLEFNDVNGSKLLREEFRLILGDIVFDPDFPFDKDAEVATSNVFNNFMDKWLRYTRKCRYA